jgi:uncharacterized protein (TIGR00369 family)
MTYDVMPIIQSIIDGTAQGDPPPFSVRLGLDKSLVFTKAERGEIHAEWHVDPEFCHRDGFVQGGVTVVVADTAQSFTFWSTSQQEESYSTVDFHTRYVRPIMAGSCIDLVSTVLNRSRRTAIIETRMTDRATGKLCAVITGGWTVAARDLG